MTRRGRTTSCKAPSFCHDELQSAGVSTRDLLQAASLILATQYHQPHQQNGDEVLLVDADLYVLGSPSAEYAAYVVGVRAEYAHVSEKDWRSGRAAVMRRFLERATIYRGQWPDRDDHEEQARKNILQEIAALDTVF